MKFAAAEWIGHSPYNCDWVAETQDSRLAIIEFGPLQSVYTNSIFASTAVP